MASFSKKKKIQNPGRKWPMVVIFMLVLVVGLFVSRYRSTDSPSAVLGRSYPLSQPDIHSGEGGTIVDSGVSVIVSEGTFGSDVYLRVDRTVRGNPVSVAGLWQVSDMWNVRLRNHENDDEISQLDTKKSYILAFPYTQDYLKTDQGVRFDENRLKLLRGETATGPWTVLESSVVDTVNKRISVVTNQGGHYTVGGGFYAPVKAVGGGTAVARTTTTVKQGIILKANEIVVTVTPTPTQAPEVEEAEVVVPTAAKPVIGDTSSVETTFLGGFFEMIRGLFR
jgi:hypothetical protein